MSEVFLFLVILWLLCGIIGAACAGEKGRGLAGFVLGVLMGPFGVIAALLLPAKPASGSAPPYDPAPWLDLKAILQLRGKVGIELSKDAMTVHSVTPGSSASRVGILPNDRIVMIDDRLATTDFRENTLRLSGEKGTGVHVIVRRDDEGHEFTLVRE